MEFVWNDGGRAASGFVGTTGDCVVRAIAIGTGMAYRNIYDLLGAASEKSPRHGIRVDVASEYLAEHGWKMSRNLRTPFSEFHSPTGVSILHLAKEDGSGQHFTTVIDGVLHDTWNPHEDDYWIQSIWTSTSAAVNERLPILGPKRNPNSEQELTQKEFDKILHRLRALERTASNSASTEGEKHNALRMMQSLMLRHNLSREDITDNDNCDQVQFTRMACPVNGSRACIWEKMLAFYITVHILPTTQYYMGTQRHRTFFWFYGPVVDVQNAIALFRELLLTIATSAQLQFGGYSKGSGASYAEGYVQGLPTPTHSQQASEIEKQQGALIANRSLTIHSASSDWLHRECDIQLVRSKRSGRSNFDPNAAKQGRIDGAQHEVKAPNAPPRLTNKNEASH